MSRMPAITAALLTLAAPGTARAEPLPPARTLVLVLVPGLSLADTEPLAGSSAALGVMPTRSDGTDALAPYRVLATGTRARRTEDLGRALRGSGVRTAALGGAGARVLAGLPPTDAENAPGRVRRPEAPNGRATDPDALAGAVRRAGVRRAGSAGQPVFLAVLFDDLARADAYAPRCLPRASTEQRRDALRRLARLLALLPGQDRSVLLVAPEPSGVARARRERLGPVLFWPAGGKGATSPALLTSPSTRGTPGLVANTDVAATVAALLSLPADKLRIGAGRPLETRAAPNRAASFAFLTRRVAAWAAQAREQKLLVGVPWALAAALLAAALSAARLPGVWAASVPLALLLAAPLAPEAEGFAGAVYALALVLSLLPLLPALRAPRKTLAGIGAATALVFTLDALLGFPLLGRSPFSYSPIEAARFYGIGNEAAGAFLGASLLAAATAGKPGIAAGAGLVVALVFGHPRLGADFGGLIAAAVGFTSLTLALRERRASRREVILAIVLGAILIAGLVAWEASRRAGAQTHIGQAVAEARARGMGALAEIAARKAAVGARLMVTSPWSALLWAEIVAGAWLLGRPRAPALSRRDAAALRAIALGGAAALLVNDSGVVAAATCLLYGTALAAAAGGDAIRTGYLSRTASR